MNETRKRGQRFALIEALVVASAGTTALLQGQATAAAVIIGSGIVSSIAAMLLGQFKGKQAPETPDQPTARIPKKTCIKSFILLQYAVKGVGILIEQRQANQSP